MMSSLDGFLVAMSDSVVASILLKVTATMALVLAGVSLARRRRAAVRHLLLLSGFGVLLALPVATMWAPVMTIAVPVASPVTTESAVGGEPALESGASTSATAARPAASGVVTEGSMPSAASVLLLVWALGTTLSLLPVAVGLRRIAALRRSGLPWMAGRAVIASMTPSRTQVSRVDVVLHEAVPGPMTCGVVRPAIVLPRDVETWSADDLRRALVHELEHVRRHDWLSQCVARVVCSAYWFHPLVWMAWRRFTLEAERVCDDAVLGQADAAQYADQLVDLARRLSSAGKAPALAMANRRDLATRVTAVLDARQPRGRASRIAAVCATAAGVVVVAAIGPVRMIAGAVSETRTPVAVRFALQSTAPQRFEAVSIRPCQDDTPPPGANGGQRSSQGGFPTVSAGRFTIDCGTVERMISNAYVLNGEKLENNSPRIGDVSWWKGGPEWIRYDKFTIEASAPGISDKAVLLGPMLRALLEDRFGLKLHREAQDAPMYAMTVAKGGLKIQPMAPDGCNDDRSEVFDAASARARADAVTAGTAKPNCGGMTMMGGPGHARWTIGGTTMLNFAGILTSWMDRHVLDKTGADPQTKYNIHLEFAPDEHVPGADKRNPRTTFDPPDAPTIFIALEQQLGLKLESTKGPQGVLIIDRVEHPKTDGGFVTPMRAKGAGR